MCKHADTHAALAPSASKALRAANDLAEATRHSLEARAPGSRAPPCAAMAAVSAALLRHHLFRLRPRIAVLLLEQLVRRDAVASKPLVSSVASLLAPSLPRLHGKVIASLAWSLAQAGRAGEEHGTGRGRGARPRPVADARVLTQIAQRAAHIRSSIATSDAARLLWALAAAGPMQAIQPVRRGCAAAAAAAEPQLDPFDPAGLLDELQHRYDFRAADLLLVQEAFACWGPRHRSDAGPRGLPLFLTELLRNASRTSRPRMVVTAVPVAHATGASASAAASQPGTEQPAVTAGKGLAEAGAAALPQDLLLPRRRRAPALASSLAERLHYAGRAGGGRAGAAAAAADLQELPVTAFAVAATSEGLAASAEAASDCAIGSEAGGLRSRQSSIDGFAAAHHQASSDGGSPRSVDVGLHTNEPAAHDALYDFELEHAWAQLMAVVADADAGRGGGGLPGGHGQGAPDGLLREVARARAGVMLAEASGKLVRLEVPLGSMPVVEWEAYRATRAPARRALG